jgi:hypothetical protein
MVSAMMPASVNGEKNNEKRKEKNFSMDNNFSG